MCVRLAGKADDSQLGTTVASWDCDTQSGLLECRVKEVQSPQEQRKFRLHGGVWFFWSGELLI
jgi:hypothetical protein